MRESFERLGDFVISGVEWVGGMCLMFYRAVRTGPRPPFGLYDISYQLVQQGMRSMPMASLMALFVGMILAWQFGDALMDFGATMALGDATSLALVRELVPAVLAVTVGVRMSAGMAAELGSMKVTEQIDAVSALGADPIKKLVWPRLVGSTIGMPVLVIWGNVVALLGGMLIADVIFAIPAGYFYETYVDELAPLDYLSSVTKAVVFGMIVGTTGCYQGFTTKFGTAAVGQSTTQTVVSASITIIIADFFLTMVFLPIG